MGIPVSQCPCGNWKTLSQTDMKDGVKSEDKTAGCYYSSRFSANILMLFSQVIISVTNC